MMVPRVGVIGAGIIGLSVARRLQRAMQVDVTVIDKESKVAAHQTSHNSNVVHSGVYYPPGSLKARLCRRGGELLRAYCTEWQLPYEEIGKVIVAVRKDEVPQLFELADRAKANGIHGSRVIDPGELREREPHVGGLSALLIPETAVVDFLVIAEQLSAEIAQTGGQIVLGHPVVEIHVRGGAVHVATDAHEHVFDHLVVCAGLQSSLVARMIGASSDPEIIPFRGEYYEIVPERSDLIGGSCIPSQILAIHFWVCTSPEASMAMCTSDRTLSWRCRRKDIGGATYGSETWVARSAIRECAKWRASTGEWALER